jgi:hydrogenase maturation protease
LNTKPVDAIANAVLYEGYMLYPYRASSVKNRQRFNFGVLYPESYSEAQSGADACSLQTECLVEGASISSLEVRVRFLKLVDRSVRELRTSQPDGRISFESVPLLEVGGKRFVPWQEAVECEVTVPACNLNKLSTAPLRWDFAFPSQEGTEPLRDASNKIVGMIIRKGESVQGTVEVSAMHAGDQLLKVQVRVKNLTSLDGHASRDEALTQSLVSAHVLLGVVNGQFVSLLEPPENLNELASSCQNVGAWPVLVGNAGERDTMLASPIILYDYPQIAPESPGDLFDGTEIDEILALRILTMTEDEKREMRSTDDRARKMLERTESLPMEHLMKLHGTLRELRSLKEETP